MSVILQDTEDLCLEIMKTLETLPDALLNTHNKVKEKLESITRSVARSKKKIMVRTEKGQEFSLRAKKVALDLSESISKLRKGDSETSVLDLVTQLEKEVSKVETYWKSYEAAVT